MGEALTEALDAATWLTPADAATVELARQYAAYVDEALIMDDPEMIHRSLSVAGPNLQKTLTSLGLNPESRKQVMGGAKEGGKLDELRKRRQQKVARG